MSETKSLAAPKASFDRRSVVKGAAWSVPVIAAAIAAPAAAASARTATITFDGPVTPVTYVGGKSKRGTAPTGFTIHNTPGAAISGTYGVTITIVRGATSMPGVGMGITGGAVASAMNYVGTVGTTTINVLVNVSGGQTQSFTFGSFTQDASGNSGTAGTYTMSIAMAVQNVTVSSGTTPLTLTTTNA